MSLGHFAMRKGTQMRGGSAPRPPGFNALEPPAGRKKKGRLVVRRPLPYGGRRALGSLPSVALSSRGCLTT